MAFTAPMFRNIQLIEGTRCKYPTSNFSPIGHEIEDKYKFIYVTK